MLDRITNALWPKVGLTIRQQFGLATGILCFAMVAILAVTTTFLGGRTAAGLARNEMVDLAGTMLDNLQKGMFERYREMQTLARFEMTVDALRTDPAKARALIEHIQSAFESYAWVGLVDPEGVVRAATKNMLTGTSVAEHAWFQDGLRGPALRDVGEMRTIADLMQTDAGQPAPKFVSLSVPVHKGDGTLVGVLGAHIHWQWADDMRRASLAGRHRAAGTEIQVLSRTGVVLLGPGIGERLLTPARMDELRTARRGAFLDESTGAAAVIGFAVDEGYRDYPGLGWVVVARQSADVAFGPVRRLVWVLIGLGVAIATAGIVLASVVAHRMTAPIRVLTDTADRIGRDPSYTMFPRLSGPTEVVRLSSVLRLLLCRLGFAEQRTLEVENEAEQETRRLNADIDTLRRLADTDQLTGLLNRRALLALAEVAIADHAGGIGLLMIDIDHFKSINDRHGHAAGDAVIRAVAQAMVAAVRNVDHVARFGGEEFIVLMRRVDAAGVVAQGERIRRVIEAAPIVHAGNPIAITISCGAAATIDADVSIADLIRRADEALYAAKRQGRNRVCAQFDVRPSSEQAA